MINLITKGADIKRTEIPPSKSHPNYPINDDELINKVTKKLLHHIDLGQIDGPHPLDDLPTFKYKIHTSPLSCKLKPSGKAMMLVDESAPQGDSINSAIDDKDKFVSYITFFQLCILLYRIGNRGWIWVVDAVDAYYRIPIQKRFYHLFGIVWLNKLLIYKCLSFGLSTAPSIYNRFADLLLWACTYWAKSDFKSKKEFNILHYLDDFFGGSPSKSIAGKQMKFLVNLFKYLNIPTNDKKVVGPTQKADILGWAVRTVPKLQIGLSERKRVKYLKLCENLLSLKNANLKQLEKVVGYIRHSCYIYIEGNKFVRGLEKQKHFLNKKIESKKFTKFTRIKLSNESIFDLEIWIMFLKKSQYRYLDIDFIVKPDSLPQINVYTDASTSYLFKK